MSIGLLVELRYDFLCIRYYGMMGRFWKVLYDPGPTLILP